MSRTIRLIQGLFFYIFFSLNLIAKFFKTTYVQDPSGKYFAKKSSFFLVLQALAKQLTLLLPLKSWNTRSFSKNMIGLNSPPNRKSIKSKVYWNIEFDVKNFFSAFHFSQNWHWKAHRLYYPIDQRFQHQYNIVWEIFFWKVTSSSANVI